MHRLDFSENYAVLDPLKGRLGFALGLVAGLAIAASWVAKVELIPSAVAGTTFNLGVGLQTVVYGFVLSGLLWGLLFQMRAGFTWALGLALGPALVLGFAAGLDSALGWGLDWQFGERVEPLPEDIRPSGPAAGMLSGIGWALAIGLLVFTGVLAMSLGAGVALRPVLISLGRRALRVWRIVAGRGVRG